jgi:hypothetical protein
MNPGTPLTLRAFNAADLTQPLVSILGGTWTHAVNSNANVVPIVAKGKVCVASNLQLRIYGLLGQQSPGGVIVPASLTPSPADAVTCPAEISATQALPGQAAVHEVYGTVCEVSGTHLRLALRSGRSLSVDMSGAFDRHPRVLLTPGRPLRVSVTIDENGMAHAEEIAKSHLASPVTPADF